MHTYTDSIFDTNNTMGLNWNDENENVCQMWHIQSVAQTVEEEKDVLIGWL